jgi:hypothetical protein
MKKTCRDWVGDTVLEGRTIQTSMPRLFSELAEETARRGPLTGIDIYEQKESDQHGTRRIGIWLCGYGPTGAALCIQIALCHKP